MELQHSEYQEPEEKYHAFNKTLSYIIIQHIDTLPKYGKKKLSMYVGPHDVHPTMDVNFSILTRECKNKNACRQYFLFKLCFVINVLNFKTIIALKLA